MLGPRSQYIAERMAADNALRFDGDHWTDGEHGVPVLNDVTAVMIARIIEVFPVANNAVIVAQVENGTLGEPDEALVYHERMYMTPAPIAHPE